MRYKLLAVVFLLIFIFSLAGPNVLAADERQPVLLIPIKGEINASQAALVRRVLTEASTQKAQAVLVEIDTFGGLVDPAVAIRDIIIDYPLPTICYIKNRAWSAGALIALAHKHIVIAPGGSLGAAEPIPATEKTIAALKAEFAATANKRGRDPRIAEAMVDKTLGLPGYAQPGQILALTDYQAQQVGYADLVAPDRETVLKHYGLANAPLIEYAPGWTERAAGWLSDPTVKSLLLSIIFLAVLTEIKTAGIGVAALLGLGAALLFFGSQWLTGFAGWLEILLFIGGLILLAMELYVPGFGLFGLTGIVAILASFFLTLGGGFLALNVLAGSLILAVIIFLLIVKRLPASKLWARLVLKESETTQAGFVSARDYSQFVGKTGTVISFLRPAGMIEIEGTQLDVLSEGRYVPPGTKVKVINVNGGRIVVRPINDEEER
ncbi:NfeD family protein [Sporolituus thermophilus]|uniref:Membrane-bound serine protease (ClpP class) n=1 Tax=Sporolituus thermophilus DSM 23256 TaxID=1123285 RepID=A0A1G7NKF7_9FIRM|nr:NfeD family protein [Sporolituus thermophilus]SDF74605.1 membrane-bound serine protease (ClpP class) [Sporolituus thermophilus DSM 23256]